MKILLILTLTLCTLSAQASELEKFCHDDPTGELYSEVIDSDIIDGFNTIGVDYRNYLTIINNNPELDLFDLVEKYQQTFPELMSALKIWKLETCITRGYMMLNDKV